MNVPEPTDLSYWRSIDQLDATDRHREKMVSEYLDRLPVVFSSVTRRNFLGLMGASVALAGLTACRRPVEKIVPYVTQPEDMTPGIPRTYATTLPLGMSALGLLVTSREGRPVKIEGNPLHPSSVGATDALAQAAILGLYDPDRSQHVQQQGSERTYADFVNAWRTWAETFDESGGQGLAVLSEPFASPSLARLKTELLERYPRCLWVSWESISEEAPLRAVQNVTGTTLRPRLHLDRADVILCLDADLLQSEPEHVRAARGFADGRRLNSTEDRMNRLYAVESGYSVTGAAADHRLRWPASRMGLLLHVVASKLKLRGVRLPDLPDSPAISIDASWLDAVAADLAAAGSRSLVAVGRRQPVWVHELALHVNRALGSLGETVTFTPAEDTEPSSAAQLASLIESTRSGAIRTLVILGGNPHYDLPGARFDQVIQQTEHTVHLSEYANETSALCEWHVPRAHFLESWGDTVAADGTLSVVQPLIEPLHSSIADVEFLALLASGLDRRGYDIVRETWQNRLDGSDWEKRWEKVLHDGLLEGSARTASTPRFVKSLRDCVSGSTAASAPGSRQLEVNFYPSQLHDGRLANNAWLQEIPDPITKLSWSNAAQVSPATAKELGIDSGDIVRLATGGKAIEIPVWVTPGHADAAVSLALGYGRRRSGRVGDGIGVNVGALRTLSELWTTLGAVITATGRKTELANTQDHGTMEGRPIVREATLAHFREHPDFAQHVVEHPPLESIYPDYDYSEGYQWGMVIDLTTCIGCNACAVACQSENNVPVVGYDQVLRGREMHWLRNDRYFVGDREDPRIVFQPVACQHCENAPCEQVCPVAATVHDSEGLNTMNYNRCIGTRYCSNNCPYKVRRFNFYNYVQDMPELVKMAQNPEVTVRARGVMEKCTFCIQRLSQGKSAAKKEDRLLRDGEVQPACQQACPTQAIHFGNLGNPNSQVVNLKRNSRNYELLAELNVRPRNSYLARVRNPNPRLEPEHDQG